MTSPLTHASEIRVGELVKYSNPQAGEEGFRFILVEHNGDRVVIEDTAPPAGHLAGQELVAVEDICRA